MPIWKMSQDGTCFRMAHHTNLKNVSGWHVFQNGTPCQSETCFRLAHVSERHTTPSETCFRLAHVSERHTTPIWNVSVWHMFQNGTQHAHYVTFFLPYLDGTWCQSETRFRLAHVSERHTTPIWNVSVWHMFQNGTQHAHYVTFFFALFRWHMMPIWNICWHMFQNGTPRHLKHVSGWHMFQNGTPRQSETFRVGICFRTAHNMHIMSHQFSKTRYIYSWDLIFNLTQLTLQACWKLHIQMFETNWFTVRNW